LHSIRSDELQSKAQFILLSLEENKTGFRAENIYFSTDENFTHLFTLLFYTGKVLLCKAMQVRYQLVVTFILCYCL